MRQLRFLFIKWFDKLVLERVKTHQMVLNFRNEIANDSSKKSIFCFHLSVQ